MKLSASEKGFVLPIAIGVGLLAILIGITVIVRSSQNRVAAIEQTQTASSLAAAETGITQFQSLFNRYRPLSTLCSTTAVCATATTWQTATDPVLAPDGACEDAAAIIQDHADDAVDNQWKNVSADASNGQFRLFSYAYKSAPSGSQLGTGMLIVEGRINANDDGSSSNRTSATRLNVQFKVNDGRITAGELPGLWINTDSASSADASVVLSTNIRNSTCTADSTNIEQLTAQVPSPSTYRYEATVGESFPPLPKQGTNLTELGAYTSIPIIDNSSSSLQNLTGASVVTYQVAENSGLSINLFSSSPLTIGTPDAPATFVLYLEGGINIADGSQIIVASGSKLIIYVHGSVSLAGSAAPPALPIAQEGTSDPKNVQIYVYPSVTGAPSVSIGSGSGSAMDLFLFAPKSQVVMDAGAKVKGMIWAKSWVGSGGAEILQSSIKATDLDKIDFPPRISPITVWQRQPVGS
jgi:type II secretory pathway pseudopilin PulG